MQISIHANALHIHLGAEQPSQLPEAEQNEKEGDLNAPLTGQDLREVAPFFVAALQHLLYRRQQKPPTEMHS